jgi:2,3-diketo-5-methylthiopentyl-1-phosphate enolase
VTRVDLVATYLARLPEGRETEAAEAFAEGQTIGTWTPVPGITEEMRERHGGRIVELRALAGDEVIAGEPVDDGATSLLRVGFPTINFGPQFPMLITTLLGNDPSTSIAARLVDIELPPGYAAGFPGPRHGTAGWRRITSIEGRPIVINMIKPCTGYPPEVGARFVEESAFGGVDLVKDDELLADPTFARVAERARAYTATLDRVAVQTGHRARYVANVTTRSATLIDTASAALDGGADALMVNGLATGLDGVQALAEADLGVPILVHTAGIESFTTPRAGAYGHRLLLGRLARLAGGDAALSSTPWAPRPLEMSRFRGVLTGCRDDWEGLRPTLPMVGGGIRADHIASLVEVGGIDLMIGVGGAIQGHPNGTAAGGRVVMQAVDAAVERSVGAPA